MHKTVTIIPLKDQRSDYAYWMSRPVAERLDAIEFLRQQYFAMQQEKSHVDKGLQRVCRIIRKA